MTILGHITAFTTSPNKKEPRFAFAQQGQKTSISVYSYNPQENKLIFTEEGIPSCYPYFKKESRSLNSNP